MALTERVRRIPSVKKIIQRESESTHARPFDRTVREGHRRRFAAAAPEEEGEIHVCVREYNTLERTLVFFLRGIIIFLSLLLYRRNSIGLVLPRTHLRVHRRVFRLVKIRD